MEQIWVTLSRKWVRLHQLRIAALGDVEILKKKKKMFVILMLVFFLFLIFLPSCLALLEAAIARTHKEEGWGTIRI